MRPLHFCRLVRPLCSHRHCSPLLLFPRIFSLHQKYASTSNNVDRVLDKDSESCNIQVGKKLEKDQELLKTLHEYIEKEELEDVERTFKNFCSQYPNTYRDSPMICREVLKCYLRASRPQPAYNFYLALVSEGFKPLITDAEELIAGLLKFSDEQKALNVLSDLKEQGLLARTTTHNLFVGYYLKDQRPTEARSFLKRMEESDLEPNQTTFLHFLVFFIKKADYEAASAIQKYVKRKRFPVDIRYYNGLIAALGKRKDMAEIESLLEEMQTVGIEKNAATYDLLIAMYASTGEYQKVQELTEQLRKDGFAPSASTFNRLLISMSHCISLEQTREILGQMSAEGIAFDGYTYTSLIQSLMHQEKYKEAVDLIFGLEKKEVKLTVDCYAMLLQLCCKKRLDPAVHLLLQRMDQEGLVPNCHIIVQLVKYFLMRREYYKCERLLRRMKEEWQTKPNIYVLNALINHYVEVMDLKKIRETLQLMKEQGIAISDVIHNVLMKAFYTQSRYQQGGHITRVEFTNLPMFDNVKDLPEGFEPTSRVVQSPVNIVKLQTQYEKMFGIAFEPTVHIYNEILLSLLIDERYDEMNSIVKEMRKRDLMANLTTFTFLIKARTFVNDIEGARALIDEMQGLGLAPTLIQCALPFHAYCRRLMVSEAEEFLKLMHTSYNIKPNHVFYGSLIYALSRRREYTRVFEVFDQMEKHDFVPDTETCNYVLISLLEIDEFAQANKFFEKMVSQGIKRNSHTYAYLAMGYLNRDEGESFLKKVLADCVNLGNSINSFSFDKMMDSFYRVDQYDLIFKCLQLMCEYSIQFDRETAPFIGLTLNHYLEEVQALPKLNMIIKKALVDYPEDNEDVSTIAGKLETALLEANLTNELESLQSLKANLPTLQKMWNEMNSIVSSAIVSSFDVKDAPNNFHPFGGDINDVTQSIASVKGQSTTNRESIVEGLVHTRRPMMAI